MYRYETHLHTSPVSRCGKVSARDNLEFYKSLGYAGVFITNHFLDGNLNMDFHRPYEERIHYYFSDYEAALPIGKELGIDVFCGVELSYDFSDYDAALRLSRETGLDIPSEGTYRKGGTDFLIYGLDKSWFLTHPEVEGMHKSELLALMMDSGALVIHAHPFREAGYIDHIRLYPRLVHGVEVYNGCRTDFENEMAAQYAKNYGLLPFAGSDNHRGKDLPHLGGMESDTPLTDEQDFVRRVKAGEMRIFRIDQNV